MLVEAVLAVLHRATRYPRSTFTPLWLCGEPIGAVNSLWRSRLAEAEPELFKDTGDALVCVLEGDYPALSQALQEAAQRWQKKGWLNGWRNENFTAFNRAGEAIFELERAAFRPLGITSRAVHLNGLSRQADGSVHMWVARRSPDKAVDPNRMDNLMGGGVAAGETLATALMREGWEEAGLAPELLADLSTVSLILAERPVQRGLHREWLYAYDVWLPEQVIPTNQDGEVAEHVLLELAEVEKLLAAERFMLDAALVTIDCLLRLNYWGKSGTRIAKAFKAVRFDPSHPLYALDLDQSHP
jgi:8-oxo-dGTP pyrophosphatase MutT (NUDIX family)